MSKYFKILGTILFPLNINCKLSQCHMVELVDKGWFIQFSLFCCLLCLKFYFFTTFITMLILINFLWNLLFAYVFLFKIVINSISSLVLKKLKKKKSNSHADFSIRGNTFPNKVSCETGYLYCSLNYYTDIRRSMEFERQNIISYVMSEYILRA